MIYRINVSSVVPTDEVWIMQYGKVIARIANIGKGEGMAGCGEERQAGYSASAHNMLSDVPRKIGQAVEREPEKIEPLKILLFPGYETLMEKINEIADRVNRIEARA
jgi:hypothetical protein